MKPQRTVEAAFIQGIGIITAAELIHLEENIWGNLRDRITDMRNGKDGLIARCMLCESPVFIRTARKGDKNLPLFQHYEGAPVGCPWYSSKNIKPDSARAAQYLGAQESIFHRKMCEQIGELVALDSRHLVQRIDEYLPPSENNYGRYPDIYVEWEGFGEFVIEFQMSNTFQTEISARCKHYEREGIPLLWVLFGLEIDRPLQQSFRDVIRRHRGNGFVLDLEAIEASKKAKTLILKCFLQNNDGFDKPVLVRFDELTIPRSRIPYYEDRIAEPMLRKFALRREPWVQKFKEWDKHIQLGDLDRNGSLLVAAVFSILAQNNGRNVNYASGHSNLKGMLNTYLHGRQFSRYTELIEHLLQQSRFRNYLDDTVGSHIRRFASEDQLTNKCPEYKTLKYLVPEVFDPLIVSELQYLDALPDWAPVLFEA